MGALDGLTILRYGHVYDDGGGGMEQYLADLNGQLLKENAVTLYQVQLTSDPRRTGHTDEQQGQGRIHTISLYVEHASHVEAIAGDRTSDLHALGKAARDRMLMAPGMRQWITSPLLRQRAPHRRAGEPEGAGRTVCQIHQEDPLDLICLHSAGGGDAEEILRSATRLGIPVVYVHHFSNDRLGGLTMRDQIDRLSGVAGVTGVGVPTYLASRFQTVADGIDTDAMAPDHQGAGGQSTEEPTLFLPARITPAKGQAEVIRVATELACRGFRPRVSLAGRTDNRQYMASLEALIGEGGLEGRVSFLGHLDRDGLKKAYEDASFLVFPTRHHEGLPRILMESQSMEVPVIGYEMGGMKEGLVEGETGFLLPPGDFNGLLNRTIALLENPGRLAAMGRAARQFALQRFGLSALAARHERFYLKALRLKLHPSPRKKASL